MGLVPGVLTKSGALDTKAGGQYRDCGKFTKTMLCFQASRKELVVPLNLERSILTDRGKQLHGDGLHPCEYHNTPPGATSSPPGLFCARDPGTVRTKGTSWWSQESSPILKPLPPHPVCFWVKIKTPHINDVRTDILFKTSGQELEFRKTSLCLSAL